MKVLLLIFISIVIAFAEIKEVNVTGYGKTFSSAKNDALRTAVEQVMGVKMQSKSLVKSGVLEEDKISSATDGLVHSFSVVKKTKDSDDDFEVLLKVEIDLESTGAKNIDVFIKDKKSMRMFTKDNFKNRSVMILYSTRDIKEALTVNEEASQSLVDDLQDQLTEKSFDVKLKDALSDLSVKSQNFDEKDALKFAKTVNSDALVLATITTSSRIKDDGFTMIKANVMLKAYDTVSGRLFANVYSKSSAMVETSDGKAFEGKTKASKKATKKAVKELLEKLVERMNTGSNKFIFLTFEDIDIDTQDALLDLLDKKNLDYKIEKQMGNTMRVKLDSDESVTGFRRVFRKWLQTTSILIKPISSQGSEIVYIKREQTK